MSEIINRVKESGLISIDLGSFKPSIEILDVDIAKTLWQGIVLREKDFREWVKEHTWSEYKNKAVYVHCSEDAIIPTWAYMLVASKLIEHSVYFVIGDKLDLEKDLIKTRIREESLEKYRDGRVIIKGCSDIAFPEYAMTELIKHLQPVTKSIMYGEPCSTVPVFKRK